MALFGDMAASGGYYVAAACEHIVARRTTITGSIGVIMSAWNFAEAAKKFGVEQVAIKSDRTPFKDILSPTRPMRDDERALLTGIVDELFDRSSRSSTRAARSLDRAQVLAVATGAVYTAGQALKNGLIDEIGDHETVPSRGLRRSSARRSTIVERRRRAGPRRSVVRWTRSKRLRSAVRWELLTSARPGPASSTSGKVAERSLVTPRSRCERRERTLLNSLPRTL
jgi:ClpP class serine protease